MNLQYVVVVVGGVAIGAVVRFAWRRGYVRGYFDGRQEGTTRRR